MRIATSEDHRKIIELLDKAFAPSRYESALIARLHDNNKPIREWVVQDKFGLKAYICYSRAYRGDHSIGYHLAPVAVRPDVQGQGVGSALITKSLSLLKNEQAPIFVLGDPKFYQRFGFTHITHPICLFDPGNKHFMALQWRGDSDFEIGYEDEFL